MVVFQSEDRGKLLLRHPQRKGKRGNHPGGSIKAKLAALSLGAALSVGCHNRNNSMTSIQPHLVHPIRVSSIIQDNIVAVPCSLSLVRDIDL